MFLILIKFLVLLCIAYHGNVRNNNAINSLQCFKMLISISIKTDDQFIILLFRNFSL